MVVTQNANFLIEINKYIKFSFIIYLPLKIYSFLFLLARTGNYKHMPIINKFL